MMKKRFIIIFILTILSSAYGQEVVRKTIFAEYQGSEDQSPREVKNMAKQIALLQAGQEIFGIYLASITETEMFSLVKNRIYTWSASKFRVIEEVSNYDGASLKGYSEITIEVNKNDVKIFQNYLDEVMRKSVNDVILEEFKLYEHKDNLLAGSEVLKAGRVINSCRMLVDGNLENCVDFKIQTWFLLKLTNEKLRPFKYIVIYTRHRKAKQHICVYGSNTGVIVDFNLIKEMKFYGDNLPQIYELENLYKYNYIQVVIQPTTKLCEIELY